MMIIYHRLFHKRDNETADQYVQTSSEILKHFLQL